MLKPRPKSSLARHKTKIPGLEYALRVVNELRRPGEPSGDWNTALDAVASDVLGDIQAISAAVRGAAARRRARLRRLRRRFRSAWAGYDRPPRWVLTPCLASSVGSVLPGDAMLRNWHLERITGLTFGADGDVPGHTGHTLETYETFEAAVAACGGAHLLPFTIIKAVAGRPLPNGNTVTARLVPSMDIITADKWWVLRLDIGTDGQGHFHDERGLGPYTLQEAMRVAWDIAANPTEPSPAPCPCIEPPAVASSNVERPA